MLIEKSIEIISKLQFGIIYCPIIKYRPILQQMFSIDTDYRCCHFTASQSGNWLVVFAENALFNKDRDELEETE